jgi:hypothetical protein
VNYKSFLCSAGIIGCVYVILVHTTQWLTFLLCIWDVPVSIPGLEAPWQVLGWCRLLSWHELALRELRMLHRSETSLCCVTERTESQGEWMRPTAVLVSFHSFSRNDEGSWTGLCNFLYGRTWEFSKNSSSNWRKPSPNNIHCWIFIILFLLQLPGIRPSGNFLPLPPFQVPMFSNIFNLCCPLSMRGQAPHPCKTTDKIMVLYVLILKSG